MATGPTNGLTRRLDALERITAEAWVNGLLGAIEDEVRRSNVDDPAWTGALVGAYRALLERWYPIKLGLELAGTPERDILRDMRTFLDAHDGQIAEALRTAS